MSSTAHLPKSWVMGFVFDSLINPRWVCLLKKHERSPEFMRGKWNGLGGEIQPGETAYQAMHREFFEEAGFHPDLQFQHFLTLQGRDLPWQVKIFRGMNTRLFNLVTTSAKWGGQTDPTIQKPEEPIDIVEVSQLFGVDTVPNLRWIIPLALDPHLSFPIVIEERA